MTKAWGRVVKFFRKPNAKAEVVKDLEALCQKNHIDLQILYSCVSAMQEESSMLFCRDKYSARQDLTLTLALYGRIKNKNKRVFLCMRIFNRLLDKDPELISNERLKNILVRKWTDIDEEVRCHDGVDEIVKTIWARYHRLNDAKMIGILQAKPTTTDNI